MKISELENRLHEHAGIARYSVAAPFDIEREDLCMKSNKYNIKKIALVSAVIACILLTSVFAASIFLSPDELANKFGDTKLAGHFDEIVSETEVDGEYKATVLGIASGEKISNFENFAWDVYPDRTYVAVAIEKADGSAMTYDDEILVTPLIEGLKPHQYNIVTMHGSYTAQVIDGILYRIIECDSIEWFADKNLYLAVTDVAFLDNSQYNMDSKTGNIFANTDYDGTNILFELELDKSKANPQKAAEYLSQLEDEYSVHD